MSERSAEPQVRALDAHEIVGWLGGEVGAGRVRVETVEHVMARTTS